MIGHNKYFNRNTSPKSSASNKLPKYCRTVSRVVIIVIVAKITQHICKSGIAISLMDLKSSKYFFCEVGSYKSFCNTYLQNFCFGRFKFCNVALFGCIRFDIVHTDITCMIGLAILADGALEAISPKVNKPMASDSEVILCLKTNKASKGPPKDIQIRPPIASTSLIPSTL